MIKDIIIHIVGRSRKVPFGHTGRLSMAVRADPNASPLYPPRRVDCVSADADSEQSLLF